MVPGTPKRVIYLDILRICATLAVIMNHVSAAFLMNTDVTSGSWNICNLFGGCVRWPVPTFFMISGILFLGREIDLGRLYRTNILRIVTAFLFWSGIYSFFNFIKTKDVELMIHELIHGHYHMWFLFVILEIYILLPVIKRITESDALMKYFLVVAFVFTILIPSIADYIAIFDLKAESDIRGVLNSFSVLPQLQYIFFFVFGFYLSRVKLTSRFVRVCVALGAIGFVGTVIISTVYSRYLGTANLTFYNVGINFFLQTLGVFVFARWKLEDRIFSERTNKLLVGVSNCTFGIYLVHVLVLENMETLVVTVSSAAQALAWCVGGTCITFGISLVISWGLSKIPVLNKYLI